MGSNLFRPCLSSLLVLMLVLLLPCYRGHQGSEPDGALPLLLKMLMMAMRSGPQLSLLLATAEHRRPGSR